MPVARSEFTSGVRAVLPLLLGVIPFGTIYGVLLTTFVINLRHVLYSASLAPYLVPLRWPWKWLLAFLLVDEAYALSIVRYRRGTPDSSGHWYALGVNLTLATPDCPPRC